MRTGCGIPCQVVQKDSAAAFKADLSQSCIKVKFFSYTRLSLVPRAPQVGHGRATKASFHKDHISPVWSGCLAAAAPSGITAHDAGEMEDGAVWGKPWYLKPTSRTGTICSVQAALLLGATTHMQWHYLCPLAGIKPACRVPHMY